MTIFVAIAVICIIVLMADFSFNPFWLLWSTAYAIFRVSCFPCILVLAFKLTSIQTFLFFLSSFFHYDNDVADAVEKVDDTVHWKLKTSLLLQQQHPCYVFMFSKDDMKETRVNCTKWSNNNVWLLNLLLFCFSFRAWTIERGSGTSDRHWTVYVHNKYEPVTHTNGISIVHAVLVLLKRNS